MASPAYCTYELTSTNFSGNVALFLKNGSDLNAFVDELKRMDLSSS